jgi:hypothetical protein
VIHLETISDDVLIKLAQKDWPSLVLLCWAYSIDLQLEQEYERTPKTFMA